jgi:hypothetical protein
VTISQQDKDRATAEDRQRVADDVCRRALKDFIGRPMTPTLMAEAEGTLRRAFDDAIRAGTYILPDGLVLDRVTLGTDMRLKILFKTSEGLKMSENAFVILRTAWGRSDAYVTERMKTVASDEPEDEKLKNRHEAVAAEIADD